MFTTKFLVGLSVLEVALIIANVTLCIAIFGDAQTLLDVFRQRPELLHAPYSQWIRPSLKIAYYLGIIGGIGKITFIIPLLIGVCFKFRCGAYACIMLELAYAAIFLVGLIFQTTFMPRPLNSCQNFDHWSFEDQKLSMFQVLASAQWSSKKDPEKVCLLFLVLWRESLSIIAAFIALSFLISFNFERIKIFLLPPIWFIYRYRKKHGYRRVPKGNILDRGLDLEKHEEDLSLSEYGTAKTEMHRDEAINILSEIRAGFSGEILHYVDVMSSMPISKSTLCHSLEPDAGIIRRDTCIDGTKSDCWGCGVQVCEKCKVSRRLAPPDTTRHLEGCKPYCSPCYYSLYCRTPNPSEWSRQFPYVYASYWHRPTLCVCRQPSQVGDDAIRELCRLCNPKQNEEVIGLRGSREITEMKHLEASIVACAGCKRKIFANGPRWWGCRTCKRECMGDVHLHWVKSGNNRK